MYNKSHEIRESKAYEKIEHSLHLKNFERKPSMKKAKSFMKRRVMKIL